jgi:serine protease Do
VNPEVIVRSQPNLQSRPQSNSLSNNRALKGFSVLVMGLALVLAQAMVANAQSAPKSFADLVDTISPSVVNITTSTTVAASAAPRPQVPEGSPLEDLFRDFLDNQPEGQRPTRRASALGSGFIISADGYIVTNNHVIENADEIMIEFFGGGELEAELVGTDPKTDIALLKVDSDDPLPFVKFGDSDVARVGDWVMAIGNPLGQGFSVSAGIISARNRALRGSYDDFIQTDAAINRGNSGGPLFNMDGDVIGVNTAILSPNGGSIGIGFSMASNVVSNVIDQLESFGETRRGWLGVRIQDVSADVAEALNLDDVAGALVTDVPDGPAKDAGVEAGDLIVTFDGKHVEDTRGLVRLVGDAEVGETVKMVVIRDGVTTTLNVVPGRRETAEAQIVPASVEPTAPIDLEIAGMRLAPLDDDLRAQLGLDDTDVGIVVREVDDASVAHEKGLRAGDLIVEAGQSKVAAPQDLEDQMEQARDAGRKSILLLVRRGGDPRFVALPLKG